MLIKRLQGTKIFEGRLVMGILKAQRATILCGSLKIYKKVLTQYSKVKIITAALTKNNQKLVKF